MKKKDKLYKLESWEILVISTCIILLLLIVSADYVCNCLSKMYPLLFSTLIGVLTGIIAAIAVLYFQRINRSYKLYNYYSKIQGIYNRIDSARDNETESDLAVFKERNNNLKIYIKYCHDNTFYFDAEYWRDLQTDAISKAKGFLEFDENNKMIAKGTYKYYEGEESVINCIGTYTAYWYDDDKTFIILFQHVFPRKPDKNAPEKNRGWEVWQKDGTSNGNGAWKNIDDSVFHDLTDNLIVNRKKNKRRINE